MPKQILFRSLALGFVLFSTHSMGQAPEATTVGHVVAVVGDCYMAVDGKDPVKLSKNDPILENATVSTHPQSFIAVQLSDQSEVKLGADSKLKFAYPAKSSEKVDLELKMGVVKSLVKKRLNSERWFKVHANAATMGVRGTEFVTSLLPVDGKQMREEVQVIHGTVQVSDRAGKELAMVKAGMGFGIRSSTQGPQILGNVLQPVRLNTTQIKAIQSEKFLVAPKNLESVKSVKVKSSSQMAPGKSSIGPGNNTSMNMKSTAPSKQAPKMKGISHNAPQRKMPPPPIAPNGTLPNSMQPQRPPMLQPKLPPPPPPPTNTDPATGGTTGTNYPPK